MRRLSFVLAVVLVVGMLFTVGCAHRQSATQQLLKQTNDPAVIALGGYYDALDLYVFAQYQYQPYMKLTESRNPVLARKILDGFESAWALLKEWEVVGTLPSGDIMKFRTYIRQILIEKAIAAGEGG